MKLTKLLKNLLALYFFILIQPIYANDQLVNSQCYSYLTELVRSSNFPFRDVSKEKVNLLIDSDDRKEISAQLVYDQPKAIDSNTFTAIGWIKYNVNEQQLFNTSVNLDSPERLVFNDKYAIEFKQCNERILSQKTPCIETNNQISTKIATFSEPLQKYVVTGKGRLYFYSAPDNNCKVGNNLFIIHNDIVTVNSEYKNFYHVIYTGKNGTVKGWVDSARLSPFQKSTESKVIDPKDQIININKNSNKCTKLSFKDENGNIDIYRSGKQCFFKNKKLSEAYKAYKSENASNDNGKYLRQQIEYKNNYRDTIKEVELEISYNWINSNELKIEMFFAGGVTTIILKEVPDGTFINTIYDAD